MPLPASMRRPLLGADRAPKPVAVLLVYLGSVALLLRGEVVSPFAYADPHFAVDYLATELQVAALLLACTAMFFQPARIGLRWPTLQAAGQLVPLVLQLAIALASWCTARWLSTPLAGSSDLSAWQILRTTLVVGVTEEWVYRGVLLAACSAWWGLRRGAAVSLLLFGALHLLNLAAGQTVQQAALQFALATLSGATLMLAALGSRSLLVPMVLHGLYDFLVIDAARFAPTLPSGAMSLAVLAAGPLLGLYSLVRIARMPAGAPYPVSPGDPAA